MKWPPRVPRRFLSPKTFEKPPTPVPWRTYRRRARAAAEPTHARRQEMRVEQLGFTCGVWRWVGGKRGRHQSAKRLQPQHARLFHKLHDQRLRSAQAPDKPTRQHSLRPLTCPTHKAGAAVPHTLPECLPCPILPHPSPAGNPPSPSLSQVVSGAGCGVTGIGPHRSARRTSRRCKGRAPC